MSPHIAARADFFQKPIIVFAPRATRGRIKARCQELQQLIPEAKVEFVDVSPSEKTPVIYHKGDVISGGRIEQFFSYARSLAGV